MVNRAVEMPNRLMTLHPQVAETETGEQNLGLPVTSAPHPCVQVGDVMLVSAKTTISCWFG